MKTNQVILSTLELKEFLDHIQEITEKSIEKKIKEKIEIGDKEEIFNLNGVSEFIKKSRQSARNYVKQGKIPVHYFADGSPFFIKSEVLNAIKSAPSAPPIT